MIIILSWNECALLADMGTVADTNTYMDTMATMNADTDTVADTDTMANMNTVADFTASITTPPIFVSVRIYRYSASIFHVLLPY